MRERIDEQLRWRIAAGPQATPLLGGLVGAAWASGIVAVVVLLTVRHPAPVVALFASCAAIAIVLAVRINRGTVIDQRRGEIITGLGAPIAIDAVRRVTVDLRASLNLTARNAPASEWFHVSLHHSLGATVVFAGSLADCFETAARAAALLRRPLQVPALQHEFAPGALEQFVIRRAERTDVAAFASAVPVADDMEPPPPSEPAPPPRPPPVPPPSVRITRDDAGTRLGWHARTREDELAYRIGFGVVSTIAIVAVVALPKPGLQALAFVVGGAAIALLAAERRSPRGYLRFDGNTVRARRGKPLQLDAIDAVVFHPEPIVLQTVTLLSPRRRLHLEIASDAEARFVVDFVLATIAAANLPPPLVVRPP